MSSLYREVAQKLEIASMKGASVKGLTFGQATQSNKRIVYALLCQTLKCTMLVCFLSSS